MLVELTGAWWWPTSLNSWALVSLSLFSLPRSVSYISSSCLLFYLFIKYLFIYLAWPDLSYRMWTLICGMWDLIPQSRIKPKPPPLESWSLATGPPRKSLLCPFLKAIAYTLSLSRIFLVSSTSQVCRSSNFQIFMTICEFLFFHCNFDIQNLVQFSFFHPSFMFFSSPQTRLTVVFLYCLIFVKSVTKYITYFLSGG